jgi:hypothetical protein
MARPALRIEISMKDQKKHPYARATVGEGGRVGGEPVEIVRAQLEEPINFDPNNRLRLAALDTRDALRKLGSKIRAAGTDPQRQGEALQVAERVSRTFGHLLRMTLEDFN